MEPLRIELREASGAALVEHAGIPIAFEVREVLDNPGSAGPLAARRLAVPYMKDYDALPAEGPRRWAERFDMTYWRLFAAIRRGALVGGAAAIVGSPEIELCEGRPDLAVLWDMRVLPEERRHGVGSALFRAIETWAAAAGRRQLKVETQDTNVAACRFYERQGCTLRAAHRFAYPDLPDEVQLLWYKDLPGSAAG